MGRHNTLLLGTGSALLMLAGTLLAPLAAHAGADGRKNTSIALGAGAVVAFLGHQPLAGAALGAGAVYAEGQYENARRSERDANNQRYYYTRRGAGYPYGDNADRNRSYSTDQDYEQQNNNYGSRRNDQHQYNGDHRSNERQHNGDRQNDGQNSYQSEQGRKRGWNGRDTNPGQWKKHHQDDNNQR